MRKFFAALALTTILTATVYGGSTHFPATPCDPATQTCTTSTPSWWEPLLALFGLGETN